MMNKKLFVFVALLMQSLGYSQSDKVVTLLKNSKSTQGFFTVFGQIKDSKSNLIIANADLYLLNCNKSVVANSEGFFQFNISKASFNDKLIISALGYSSDTIIVSD